MSFVERFQKFEASCSTDYATNPQEVKYGLFHPQFDKPQSTSRLVKMSSAGGLPSYSDCNPVPNVQYYSRMYASGSSTPKGGC